MKIKLFFLIFFVLLFVSCSSSRKISTPKTNKVTITESPYKNVSPVQQVQHVKKLQKSNKSLNKYSLQYIKKYAPIAAAAGCVVVDNSSAWRMDETTPLVVPEVNPEALKDHKGIIANPNCSTIQLMLPLKAIQENYGLKRVICSTYQSITGAGQKGLDKLENELSGNYSDEKPIAFNTLFHPFDSNGFTNEENKMINESRKILGLPELNIAVT